MRCKPFVQEEGRVKVTGGVGGYKRAGKLYAGPATHVINRLSKVHHITMLSAEQVAFFKANGYLIVRDILNDAETAEVQKWAQEVHDWTPTADSQYMPYEVR